MLFASFSVMVMAEVEVPSGSIGPVPVIVDVVALGDPAVKTTVLPVLFTGAVSETIFDSALVELKMHVETPVVALLAEQAP